MGLAGGLNTYQYANENPLRFVDPSGRLFIFLSNAISRNPIPTQDALNIDYALNTVELGTTAGAAVLPTLGAGASIMAPDITTSVGMSIIENGFATDWALDWTSALAPTLLNSPPGPPDATNPWDVLFSAQDMARQFPFGNSSQSISVGPSSCR